MLGFTLTFVESRIHLKRGGGRRRGERVSHNECKYIAPDHMERCPEVLLKTDSIPSPGAWPKSGIVQVLGKIQVQCLSSSRTSCKTQF